MFVRSASNSLTALQGPTILVAMARRKKLLATSNAESRQFGHVPSRVYDLSEVYVGEMFA